MTVQLTSLSPAASGWDTSWSSAPTSVRRTTRRGVSLSSTARSPRTARSGVASVQTTRSPPMRTGPVSCRRTGRQRPPGFHVGSTASQCWKMPVMFRFDAEPCWGVQVTSTATACSDRSASAR